MSGHESGQDQGLDRIRATALALPEVTERYSHGAPAFFFRDKRPICYFHDSEFASDGRTSIWCPAPPGAQEHWITTSAERYFAPTPSASGVFRDWIAAFLDGTGTAEPDWDEISDMLEQAFRHVAPKKVAARLDEMEP